MRQRFSDTAIFIASVIIPGFGFVLLGKPARGLMYVVWIIFFGYLTSRIAPSQASLIGRYSGGIAIWALSLVELYRVLKRRAP